MATRLYLLSTGVPLIAPAAASGWNFAADMVTLPMVAPRISTAMLTKSVDDESTTVEIAYFQFVSAPLREQTLTGTVSGRIRGSEDNANNQAQTAITIRTFDPDGSTVRGTNLALEFGGTEFDVGTLENRKVPNDGSTLTSVNILDGDMLVAEIGVAVSGIGVSGQNHLSYGSDSGTDLGLNETDTSAFNPWLEFSQTLLFVLPESGSFFYIL